MILLPKYLQRILGLSVRLVDSNIRPSTYCYLPRSLVKSNGFERRVVVIVDGLKYGIWTREDNDCVPSDVCLSQDMSEGDGHINYRGLESSSQ